MDLCPYVLGVKSRYSSYRPIMHATIKVISTLAKCFNISLYSTYAPYPPPKKRLCTAANLVGISSFASGPGYSSGSAPLLTLPPPPLLIASVAEDVWCSDTAAPLLVSVFSANWKGNTSEPGDAASECFECTECVEFTEFWAFGGCDSEAVIVAADDVCCLSSSDGRCRSLPSDCSD
jgi:hypothetical protein